MVHDDLKAFLEANIPTGKKKSKVALGISDAKIGGVIQEACNIQCEYGQTVSEILRGVRLHFHKMIQGRPSRLKIWCDAFPLVFVPQTFEVILLFILEFCSNKYSTILFQFFVLFH